MAAMTKRERVWAAVHGTQVDRPPFLFWHHFKPHNVPHELAQSTIEFFGRFDLDIYKVMPDMPYPFPQSSIRESDDWDLVATLAPDASNLGRMVQTTALVRDAVSNNFDLRAAAARVREARALRGITASRGKPQVAGDASALKVERSIAVPGFGDRRLDVFDVGFDASWELDLFGGIRHDREAALAQVQATDEERRDLQITLTAEVARNYVELRGAQKRLDVLDARIQTLRDTLDIVRSRQAAGLTNELDTIRSEALPCLRSHSRTSSPGLRYGMLIWHCTVCRKSMRSGGAVRIATELSRSRRCCGVRVSRAKSSAMSPCRFSSGSRCCAARAGVLLRGCPGGCAG